MEAEAIVAALKVDQKKVCTSFVVDSMEYLARSGRISEKIATLCRVLMLHPVITLRRSRITVGAMCVGTRAHTWRHYVASSFSRKGAIDNSVLFITYAGMNKQELEMVEALVREKMYFKKIIFQKASPAILTNCGPGSFGLLYMKW